MMPEVLGPRITALGDWSLIGHSFSALDAATADQTFGMMS